MSALQSEIIAAVQQATAPLMRELSDLRRIVESQHKDSLSEFVTVKEAAEILHVTTKTIHKHCDEGRFDVQRHGHKKLIRRSSLAK